MNHQVNQFTHIFNEALDLPAQERESYVKQLCGSDAELFARIMDLLKSADEASLFFNDLQQDMYGSLATSPDLTDLELLNYKISDKLGEGGMATVYKAQRIDGLYDHEVAIKVFDKGGHHPELAQRFEAERSILAALAHPNIAKILDAGITPQGAPFYILEYIKGHNVLDYVKTQKYNLRQTLQLFLKITQAVQFAHQNFVIHRDLKPDNILVDALGEPKLLDFGIAKVLDNASLPTTQTQAFLLTPDYAAPEQLKGGNITTATDVYLLGLLLYELATLEKPYQNQGKAPAEILEARQQQRLATPFKKVAQPEGISADLDNVVLKALAQAPEERYTGVQALVDDVQALLANRPVKARPASWGYKAKKYAQRNPAIVGISALSVLVLVVSTLLYIVNINKALADAKSATNQAVVFQKAAEQEAKVSKEVSNFLTSLFASTRPSAKGKDVSAREVLNNGFEKIQKRKQAPEVKVRLLITMGETFRVFNQHPQAKKAIAQAASIYAQAKLNNDYLQALIYKEEGMLLRDVKGEKMAQALAKLQAAAQIFETMPDLDKDQRKVLANVYRQTAYIYQENRQVDKGIGLMKKQLDNQQKLYGNTHDQVAQTLYTLASLYTETRHYDSARIYQEQSLEICRALYKKAHPGIAANLGGLATIMNKLNKIEDAERLHLEALKVNKALYGEKHREIATNLLNLGNNLFRQRKLKQSISYYQQSVDMFKDLFGAKHSLVAGALNGLAKVYAKQGAPEKAIEILKECIKINQSKKRVAKVAINAYYLGKAYFQTKEYALSEKYLSQAAQTFEQPKARKTYLYYIYFSLGKLYDAQNDDKKAEAFYLKALAGFEKNKLRKAQTKEVLQALVKYYQKQRNTVAQNKHEALLEKYD